MPQILLEYTSNLGAMDHEDIFAVIHDAMSTIGDAKIENCKSRARIIENYYIGDGESNSAFIHVDINLLEGRRTEMKENMAKHIQEYIESLIVETWREDLNTQITVHFRDIIKADYFKKEI